MCLGDGTDLGHAPAAFGMDAKKGTGITRDPERAAGSQGLLPHFNTLKIPLDWEGRCSHKGSSLVIHTQGFLLPTALLLPGSLLAPSSAFFHSGRGAAWSSVPVLPAPARTGRNKGHSPTQGGHGSAIPRLDIFPPGISQDLCFPLCWVMPLLSCLSSLWMHPPRAEQAGISLRAGRGRIPEC